MKPFLRFALNHIILLFQCVIWAAFIGCSICLVKSEYQEDIGNALGKWFDI